MSLWVVSDPYFESRLALHTNQYKLKRTLFIVCLKKFNFLRTTPNIGNIYIYISNRSSWKDELINTAFESEWWPRREKWFFKFMDHTSTVLLPFSQWTNAHHCRDRVPHRLGSRNTTLTHRGGSVVGEIDGNGPCEASQTPAALRRRWHSQAPHKHTPRCFEPPDVIPLACVSPLLWVDKGEERESIVQTKGEIRTWFFKILSNLNWSYGQFWLTRCFFFF